jgi:hypothetical protein
MENTKTRIPKKGDHVTIYGGKEIIFVVVAVHHDPPLAEIRPLKNGKEIGPSQSVPWTSLKYEDKGEDFSQAAARIVREATQD